MAKALFALFPFLIFNLYLLGDDSAILEAVRKGDVKAILRENTKQKIDVNAPINGINLLKEAFEIEVKKRYSSSRKHEMIQCLLDLGAKPNFIVNDDHPLQITVQWRWMNTSEKLLINGADPNVKDLYGNHVLKVAFEKEIKEYSSLRKNKTINDLISAGANISVIINESNTKPIHLASKYGWDSTVSLLLDKGDDINVKDKYGNTPLMIASHSNKQKTGVLLIQKGADVSLFNKSNQNALELTLMAQFKEYSSSRSSLLAQNIIKLSNLKGMTFSNHETPLTLAAKLDWQETSKVMLKMNADLNIQNQEDLLPYEISIKKDDKKDDCLDVFSLVYINNPKQLTELKKIIKSRKIDPFEVNPYRYLYQASYKGNLKAVKILLECGLDINEKNANLSTSVQVAIQKKKNDVAKYLISNGAELNSVNKYNKTALEYAYNEDSFEMIELLIKSGVDLNQEFSNGWHILPYLGYKNNIRLTKFCLIAEASLNIISKYNGELPITYAIRKEKPEILNLYLVKYEEDRDSFEFLKKHYSNIGTKWEKKSHLDLINASRLGYEKVVDFLLTTGIGINSTEDDGDTALIWAASKGHLTILKKLIAKGATLDVANKQEKTALFYALEKKNDSIAEYLIDAGADVNLKLYGGEFPINNFCYHNNIKLLEKACLAGAKLYTENSKGVSAAKWAITKGNLDCLKILIKNGLDVTHIYSDGKTILDYVQTISSSDQTTFKEVIENAQKSGPKIAKTSDRVAKSINSKESALNKMKRNVDNTPPEIRIISPVATRGFSGQSKSKATQVSSKKIEIKGQAIDPSGVVEVLINGRDANLDENGNFLAGVFLRPGKNSITIAAMDIFENIAETSIEIDRASTQVKTDPTSQKVMVEAKYEKKKYYALLIAVDDYQSNEITSLEQPVKDAMALKKVLVNNYTFLEENVVVLKNPTRDEIIENMDIMSRKVKEDDNLLIFYAGHGYWDEEFSQGFWLPADSQKLSRIKWISNSIIRDYIRGIRSKHTLLIADACFSGGIFKTRSAFANENIAMKELDRLPSRKAMTSGTLKEVPDKSVFIKYLVERLSQNKEGFLTSEGLFASFKKAVINNSPINQIPQYGEIRQAGDEGGDFIFQRR